MKKFLFLLFIILSLNTLSTVYYTSLPDYPWFQDISIDGCDYGTQVIQLTSGEYFKMTLLTHAVDYEVTTCKLTVTFTSGITPYPLVEQWALDKKDVYSAPYQAIQYEITDIVGAGNRWPVGFVIMRIFLEDQNGLSLGAAKVELLIL